MCELGVNTYLVIVVLAPLDFLHDKYSVGLGELLETPILRYNSSENPLLRPSVSQPSMTLPWLPVRHQPATCSLPCILCLSITRRVLVSRLNAGSNLNQKKVKVML